MNCAKHIVNLNEIYREYADLQLRLQRKGFARESAQCFRIVSATEEVISRIRCLEGLPIVRLELQEVAP